MNGRRSLVRKLDPVWEEVGNIKGPPGNPGAGGTPNTFDVTEYGAVGDDVTDDSAAIQSCIQACFNAGGGNVFMPYGSYLCDGAFSAFANSILTIPHNPYTNLPITIRLLGEAPTAPPGAGGYTSKATTIRTTKTGTGTAPAVIAAGPSYGSGYLTMDKFNAVFVCIENVQLRVPSNPSLNGIRLDTAGYAYLKHVQVNADGTSWYSPPSNNVTGIWMPNAGNWARSRLEQCVVCLYPYGFRFGDHFEGYNLMAAYCVTGYEFAQSMHQSIAWLRMQHCKTGILFSGKHPVFIIYDSERAFDVGSGNTYGFLADVNDTFNYGQGEIRYAHYNYDQFSVPEIPSDIVMIGGANLKTVNMRSRQATGATVINLRRDLAAYWKLDETSGERKDRHGQSDLKDAGADPVGSATGIFGVGAQFNHLTDNQLTCPSNDALKMNGDFTIALWIKLLTQNTGYILAKYGATCWEYDLEYTAQGFQWGAYFVGIGDRIAIGYQQTLDQWYHVICWYDSVQRQRFMSLDADTILVNTSPQGTAPLPGDGGLIMGDGVNAIIDEVGIWKRILSANERVALYNAGAGVPYSGF